jgi:hypothetical protein
MISLIKLMKGRSFFISNPLNKEINYFSKLPVCFLLNITTQNGKYFITYIVLFFDGGVIEEKRRPL